MATQKLTRTTLSLSGIRNPLPYRESEFAGAAEAVVRTFAETYQLKPASFEAYNTMSRFLYPGAISVERLAAACMVHSIFFFIDDLFFDTESINPADHHIDPALRHDLKRIVVLIKTLMSIFRTRQLPPDAASGAPTSIERAFAFAGDYVAQASVDHGSGDEAWFQYFVDTVDDYIDAVLYRDQDLDQHTHDLLSFAKIRERDTGGLHTCVLIELTNGISLPEGARDHAMFKHLTSLAVRQASFVNDIISYPKDVLEESSGFNLIKVFMDRDSLTFEEAVRESIGLVNSYTDAFLAIERSFDAEPEVLRYVHGLKEMFCGNLYWELTTPRYRTEDSPFTELTPGFRA